MGNLDQPAALCGPANQIRPRPSNYYGIFSTAHDRQPRQTCLGGGVHCPDASSFESYSFAIRKNHFSKLFFL